MSLRPYYVVSPEYEMYSDQDEPPEWGCDVVEVEAGTKREAVVIGVRRLLGSRHQTWPKLNRMDERSPFAGMRAELAVCGHGIPHFVLVRDHAVDQVCWACKKEFESCAV